MKTGVILLDIGGPKSPDHVRSYLYRFMNNRSMLNLPTPLRQTLALLISGLRGGRSKKNYSAILPATSVPHWTIKQARALEELLKKRGNDPKVGAVMRASDPDARHTLEELRKWGAERLVLVSMFPQRSESTTGAGIRQIQDELRGLGRRYDWRPEVVPILGFYNRPEYIELLRDYLQKTLSSVDLGKTVVIVAAHSLPEKVIKRGDPYEKETKETVTALTRGLSCRWLLAYQSLHGPGRWLGPDVKDEIKRLATEGWTSIVVCPVSFVNDHIETLWELDIELAEIARAAGITQFKRVPVFNDDPRFTELLAKLALS
jgi:ferrochelatase